VKTIKNLGPAAHLTDKNLQVTETLAEVWFRYIDTAHAFKDQDSGHWSWPKSSAPNLVERYPVAIFYESAGS
jgi:hypothetical protein